VIICGYGIKGLDNMSVCLQQRLNIKYAIIRIFLKILNQNIVKIVELKTIEKKHTVKFVVNH